MATICEKTGLGAVERVDLFISAKGLPKLHTFDATDPFAVVFYFDKKTNMLVRIGGTELIKDCYEPKWVTPVTVEYQFGTQQDLFIRIYHSTHSSVPITDLTKHDFIGEVRFPLSQLMVAPSQRIKGAITNSSRSGPLGEVEVRGEAQTDTRDVFCVTFSCEKLANKEGFFGTSDPFLEISRLSEDGSWTPVWKNEHVNNSLSPKWGIAKIPMLRLCNADLERPLRITVFDFESSGKHKAMGVAETSVRSMLQRNGDPMDIIEADKKGKKGYANSGTLKAQYPSIEHHPTFSEFVMGGMEINLVVGIDFTGSNGDPHTPQSLHYIDPAGKTSNIYQQAIHAVGTILNDYDTDKEYNVFGYGARVKTADGTFSPVQHCFPVYSGSNKVKGVEGILQAYSDCMHNVMLSGPTLMAPIIHAATQIAHAANFSQTNQKYTVLLIITDGAVNDMDATIDAIITASSSPLSVIIVGVGPADFTDMNILDTDKQLLKQGSKTAERDIVQFVPFTPALTAQALAGQVLSEIPNQVIAYCEKRNIVPNPRKA